jgi:hypothetical protein
VKQEAAKDNAAALESQQANRCSPSRISALRAAVLAAPQAGR